jgi:ArsR family transcriptional regulator, arsenate/arsenite/antimonite-responsive transcriptional repressor
MAYSKKEEFSDTEIVLANFAKALSHPARIAILRILAARSTCICGEIVEELPLSQSTVSQHLKALKEADLIQGDIDGPKTCYCLNPVGVAKLSKLLPQFVAKILKGLERKDKCC